MNRTLALKAIADETRMRILTLLLQRNYCVRALSRKIGITEAAVSQHLKVLREAELLIGEKKGYFMHYDVDRTVLHELSREIEALAVIKREDCTPRQGGCHSADSGRCHIAKSDPGHDLMEEGKDHEHRCCHKS